MSCLSWSGPCLWHWEASCCMSCRLRLMPCADHTDCGSEKLFAATLFSLDSERWAISNNTTKPTHVEARSAKSCRQCIFEEIRADLFSCLSWRRLCLWLCEAVAYPAPVTEPIILIVASRNYLRLLSFHLLTNRTVGEDGNLI